MGEQRERVIAMRSCTPAPARASTNCRRRSLHTFVVSQDVTPDEHVLMQAALQQFVDNSISKTCNFPPKPPSKMSKDSV